MEVIVNKAKRKKDKASVVIKRQRGMIWSDPYGNIRQVNYY